MAEFKIIDQICDPGDVRKANDDWVSANEKVAIVSDGATGLGNERLLDDCDSDAQWVAKRLCERFASSDSQEPVRELVADVCKQVRAAVFGDEGRDVPRHSWPVAGFIAARIQGDMLEITGLGDCIAYLRFTDGYIQAVTPLPSSRGHEVSSAASALAKQKSNGPALEDESVLAVLRKSRAMQNTPESNVWTVSAVPEAANHVMSMAIPLDAIDAVLLASDGFSAAVEDYDIVDAAGLFERIETHGVGDIVSEIRRIEREIDPEQTRFPRFKQSDDASAILVKTVN